LNERVIKYYMNKSVDKKFVENLSPEIIKRVLYNYLVEGHSYRKIGRETEGIDENHGWDAWNIVQYYGFNKEYKGMLKNFSLMEVESYLDELKATKTSEYEIKVRDSYVIKEGKEVYSTVKTRIGQSELRKATIANYKQKCGFCNISELELLFTAHIKHWSQSTSKEKTDLGNAILLCPLHDLLFEHGFITLSDNYEVMYKDKKSLSAQGIDTNLIFKKPPKSPYKKYLEYHRDYHNF